MYTGRYGPTTGLEGGMNGLVASAGADLDPVHHGGVGAPSGSTPDSPAKTETPRNLRLSSGP